MRSFVFWTDKRFEGDREHMLELTTALGERITAKTTEISTMVRMLEEQTKEQASALDATLNDNLGQLRVATNDRAVRHDQRLDLLERDASSLQQEVRKSTKNVELLDGALQNLQRETGTCFPLFSLVSHVFSLFFSPVSLTFLTFCRIR